jgi:hypothetical protein
MRPGLRATVVAAAVLLAATYGAGSAAGASAEPGCGHLYWTNGYWIGTANLNGTGVNQRLITKVPYGTGIAAVHSGYMYWADLNAIGGKEIGLGTIGRARLNGTRVNELFIITKPSKSPIGLFGLAVDTG